MAVIKLFNIFAISSLAILACSFWHTPVNALSVDSHYLARHNARGHEAIAIKKRSNSTNTTKRCKPRPSPSTTSTTSTTASPSPTQPPAPAKAKATPHEVSSSSSSSSSQPASTPVSGGGGKIGLAWPNGDDPVLSQYKTSQTNFLYSWTPFKPSLSDKLGFEFMPMLWCDDQIADFTRLVVPGYASHALAMNEPNEPGQCNISPEHGAFLYQTYLQPLKDKGYKIYTPAVSSSPTGMVWMKAFFAACQGCHFDGLALHWYDKGIDKFIAYMTNYHDTFNMPLLITEFACQNFNNDGTGQCTIDEVWAFMTAAIRWCKSTEFVTACMPFGFMKNLQGVNPLDSLMNSDGSPSPLGRLVIDGAP